MRPYTVTKINDDTWQIAEVYHSPAALPMYLIVGKEKAALIDTGTGMDNLRETVEEITDLPVTVFNTHTHLDHAAGNHRFDRVCMNCLEEAAARVRDGFSEEARREFVELKCMYDPEAEEIRQFALEHMLDYDPEYDIFYIEDGEEIDLGGITLTALNVPGHTFGSMVYLDRKNGNAFCGDAVNPRSSIGMFPGSPTVEMYAHSLRRLLALTPDIERYFVGHRLYSFSTQDVEDVLACAEEILAGNTGEPYPMIVSRKGPIWGRIHWHNGKRITFNENMIRKTEN